MREDEIRGIKGGMKSPYPPLHPLYICQTLLLRIFPLCMVVKQRGSGVEKR
jgi:hypothetical protein